MNGTEFNFFHVVHLSKHLKPRLNNICLVYFSLSYLFIPSPLLQSGRQDLINIICDGRLEY